MTTNTNQTILTMATETEADAMLSVPAIRAHYLRVDVRRTARVAGMARVLPMARPAFEEMATANGWTIAGDYAVGPDGAAFILG